MRCSGGYAQNARRGSRTQRPGVEQLAAAGRQGDRDRAAVARVARALDDPPPLERVEDPRRRRWRYAALLGELGDTGALTRRERPQQAVLR